MTTFEDLPLSKIKAHPRNIRRHVEADPEMVASVKGSGIITALTVAPAGKGYVLLAGHRRLDAARQAKLKTVPAMVREDLTTDEQHIEAMAIENVHREDLSAIEEAEAYEQLTLIGLDPDAIAEKSGRKKSTITARLKLASLNAAAKDAVHNGQITLEQGEKLTKLQAHPELLEPVEAAFGTHNFHWKLEDGMRNLQRQVDHEKRRGEYSERGLKLIEKPEGGWDYATGPGPLTYGEDETKADAWFEGDTWSGPTLVRLSIDKETEADDAAVKRAKEAEEREAYWAAERKKDEDRAAARIARLRHVVDNTPALKLPKAIAPLATMAVAQMVLCMDGGPTLEDINAIAGTDISRDPDKPNWQGDAAVFDEIRKRESDLPKLLVACFALWADSAIDDAGYNLDDEASVRNALTVMQWFESTGYALSDVDVELRDSFTTAEELGAA